jgi:hypothetical protein
MAKLPAQRRINVGKQKSPTLIGNLFECQATGAWPKNSNRDDDREHREGHENKNSCGSKTLEEEAYDENAINK